MNSPETQPQTPAADQAQQLIAAIEDAMRTSYRDETPVPAIGTAPPVPQPGRPPMSQKAVDLNTTILTSSVLTAVVGGSATSILWASGHANPVVVASICAAPVALAVPVLALSRVMKRVKEAAEAGPPTIHQHYTGTVHQEHRTVNSQTRGLVANTRNQLPR